MHQTGPKSADTTDTNTTAPRRALVTGGAGFIGSHLTDRLLAMGDRVVVVDNLSTGRRANLPEAHDRLRVIVGDLGAVLQGELRGERFNEIYHLAAAVGVKLVVDDPIGSIENNVGQTGELLKFASSAGHDGRPCPTLIASSSEVYGKSERVPFREDDDVTYGPTIKSRWSYAASKAIDEYLVLAYHQQRGLPGVVARFFNTVGPRQVGEYGMVLPRFVAAAIRNDPIHVHGDGQQSRCFCDVRDVAELLPRLVRATACHGRVFNVGSDVSVTILDLAKEVIRVLRSTSEIRSVSYDSVYTHGFEDLRRREPDLSRVREVLGFTPRISLQQTILDLADNLRTGARR